MKGVNVKKFLHISFPILSIISVFSGAIVTLLQTHFFNTIPKEPTMSLGIFAIVLFGFCFTTFFVEFVTIFHISDSTLHTAVFSFFLSCVMLFSPDVSFFFSTKGITFSPLFLEIASNVSFVGYVLSTLWFFQYTFRPGGKKTPLKHVLIFAAACLVAYIILLIFSLQIIAHLAFCVLASVWFVLFQKRVFHEGLDNITFALTSFILFSCIGLHSTNVLAYSGLIKSSWGWSNIYMLACITGYVSVYIAFFVRVDKDAQRGLKYKLQAAQMRTKILNEQLKPHFYFNSLTTIKSMYHKSSQAGDQAIELFSEFLRERIGMIDAELIPFERELENISRYIDFCNLSVSKEFKIIYDIDATNFCIPAFVIQPFVENIIKHSRINEKEDGHIIISTYSEGEHVVLRIADNGIGFDMSKLAEREGESYGINNAIERFKLVLDIEPKIESSPNNGTQITVLMPIASKEVSGENPNS